jgi:tetratricopeptide (TPR) repeat protein
MGKSSRGNERHRDGATKKGAGPRFSRVDSCVQGKSVPPLKSQVSYDLAFERALLKAGERQRELAGDRIAADRALRRLPALDENRQELFLRNSQQLATFAALERFLEAANAALADPERAINWARRALALAPRLDPTRYGQSLLNDSAARAWVIWAQAARALGRLEESEEALRSAYQCLLRGTQDPIERATWLEARAALRQDLGRIDQAASLLRRAADLFEEAGERSRASNCWVVLARIARSSQDHTGAADAARKAISLAEGRPSQRFVALCELAEALLACGNGFAARSALEEIRRAGSNGLAMATADELADRIDRFVVPDRVRSAI